MSKEAPEIKGTRYNWSLKTSITEVDMKGISIEVSLSWPLCVLLRHSVHAWDLLVAEQRTMKSQYLNFLNTEQNQPD
jgi:hypothetical protein